MKRRKTEYATRKDKMDINTPQVYELLEVEVSKFRDGKEQAEKLFKEYMEKWGSPCPQTLSKYRKLFETEYYIVVAKYGLKKGALEGNPRSCELLLNYFGGFKSAIDVNIPGLKDIASAIVGKYEQGE